MCMPGGIKGDVDGMAMLMLGGVSIGRKLLRFPRDGARLRSDDPSNMDDALGKPLRGRVVDWPIGDDV